VAPEVIHSPPMQANQFLREVSDQTCEHEKKDDCEKGHCEVEPNNEAEKRRRSGDGRRTDDHPFPRLHDGEAKGAFEPELEAPEGEGEAAGGPWGLADVLAEVSGGGDGGGGGVAVGEGVHGGWAARQQRCSLLEASSDHPASAQACLRKHPC
jgi:hypothetical protein